MKMEDRRERLKEIESKGRFSFEAIYEKEGVDRRFPDKKKALVLNVYLIVDEKNKKLMTDHLWITKSRRWKGVSEKLNAGDKISFTAEVKTYLKEGKRDYFEKYGLTSIRSVQIINEGVSFGITK